ncbi:hypothetical protein F443_04986 [Phytophthora nicotianae P1569]|uniref:Uncharacterized protein n=1 Tax=Phytophthora nicotianae P1569 TaxID=1317065 RepID=V9FLP1_PHYNI|nr:hypothetical protein F443_04986 [Phytophthora nicotianae P1569]
MASGGSHSAETMVPQSNSSILQASIDSVRLSRHEVKILPAKKQNFLAAKYFSISPQHLSYYPNVPDATLGAPVTSEENESTTAAADAPGKKPKQSLSQGASVVGIVAAQVMDTTVADNARIFGRAFSSGIDPGIAQT